MKVFWETGYSEGLTVSLPQTSYSSQREKCAITVERSGGDQVN